MITPTVVELDVRENTPPPQVIRFADDYQNKFAGACVLVHDEALQDVVHIKNEGYSRVALNSAESARSLIKALEQAIALGWLK